MISSTTCKTFQHPICRYLYVNMHRQFSAGKENPSASTIDENEIHNLSKFAESWWNPKGSLHALHRMNELRVPFIRDNLINIGKTDAKKKRTSTPLQGVHILEVGCGGGLLSEALARIGANVTGLDISKELITVASEHANKDSIIKERIKYQVGTIEDYAEKNECVFDAVVCSEVIEHVSNKDLFIKSAVQTLKPGGSIFVTTLEKTLASWFAAIIIAEYVLNIVPRGTHEHDKFISPHEMQRLLELHDCSTRVIQGMLYNPITQSWSWSRATINYALHAVKSG